MVSPLETVRSRITGWTLRSAFRFAAAIVVADALLLFAFGPGTPVTLGSLAVIILLYMLDYAGSLHQRVVGFTIAWLSGLVTLALGAALSQTLALAVIGALVVSSGFAFARVLRGFTARAAVALQGPFFLALIDKVTFAELPDMLAAWTLGSAVAIVAGLFLWPNRPLERIRASLATWLSTASATVSAPQAGNPAAVISTHQLGEATESVLAAVRRQSMPGAVGPRQRALAEMVDSTRWSFPAFEALAAAQARNPDCEDERLGTTADPLLQESASALWLAADAVLGKQDPDAVVPDLATDRERDLDDMIDASATALNRHYPVRLISIIAMRMLWLSGRSSGIQYPKPDLGGREITPIQLIRLNLVRNSIWPANALRTGVSSAVCVFLVSVLGLQHGLWVLLAALGVTQVTFSGTASGASSVRVAAGSVAGVLVAGLGPLINPGHLVFAILLPFAAFLAVIGTAIGPFTAQFLYTPFTLINLASLEWATQRDMELVRLENVALGVAVAALFALAVFPFGLSKQLARQGRRATDRSLQYLDAAVAAAHGNDDQDAHRTRPACVAAIVQLESSLDGAKSLPVIPEAELPGILSREALARDRLIGGDACMDVSARRAADPAMAELADGLSQWWSDRMGTNAKYRVQPEPGV